MDVEINAKISRSRLRPHKSLLWRDKELVVKTL